jgi:hypothetical protein
MYQYGHIHPVFGAFSLDPQSRDPNPRLVVEMEAMPELNT